MIIGFLHRFTENFGLKPMITKNPRCIYSLMNAFAYIAIKKKKIKIPILTNVRSGPGN